MIQTTQTGIKLPQYKCHKVVQAVKIVNITTSESDFTLKVESPYTDIHVTVPWYNKHNPEIGGYYVIYEDGYTSYSPAEPFEKGYSKFPEDEYVTLGFGRALELMKEGAALARIGWNGNGMFAVYSPGYENLPAEQFFSSKLREFAQGRLNQTLTVRPALMLKTAQNDVAYWTPSTSDILATDWLVVYPETWSSQGAAAPTTRNSFRGPKDPS